MGHQETRRIALYTIRRERQFCKRLNYNMPFRWFLERRGSAIDGRTIRHIGYQFRQSIRKRGDEFFDWKKTLANFRRARFGNLVRTQPASYLIIGSAYNLLRMAKPLAPA